MEFSGKISAISPLQQGNGQNGEWKSIDFCVEQTEVQYPESLVCRAKGELAQRIADAASGMVGTTVKAHIGFKARTYTGKDGERHSLTDITCWKLESNDDLPF